MVAGTVSPSPLVGRARELEEVVTLLAGSDRLITIVGPAGAGKTRLLLEVGASRQHDVQVGLELVGAGGKRRRPVVTEVASPRPFCDLSAASSADDVLFAVARSLEVDLAPSRQTDQVPQHLAAAIEARPRLLLIDNAEQVAEPVRRLLGELLRLAPGARFLVTSRVPLGASEEALFRLGPLDARPAVELLLQVVRRSAPGASWDLASARLLETIVNRVDRLPLALRLVGARARLLTPEQTLQRLDRQLEFLRAGAMASDERHASMRAALAWSWELLDPFARRTAEHLSIFPGSFSVAAALAVVEPDPAPDAPPTLEVLEALADQSLLQTFYPTRPGEDVRLALYVCVRELAAAHLVASGDEHAARERHAAHFAQAVEPVLAVGDGDLSPWSSMKADLDDITAAATSCLQAQPGRSARLLLARSFLLGALAPLTAQRDLLEAAAAAAGRAQEHATQIDALHTLARHLTNAGFLAESLRHVEAGLAVARASGDQGREAKLLTAKVYVAVLLDQEAMARDALEQARGLADNGGDLNLQARLLMFAAMLDEEPIDASAASFDRVAVMGRAIPNPRTVWYGLMNAVEARVRQGTEPGDSPHLATLATLNEVVADRQMLVWFTQNQTRLAFSHGDPSAADLASRAIADARALGTVASEIICLALAAEIALDQRGVSAWGHLLVARELLRSVDSRPALDDVLRVEGHVREDEGDLAAAQAATSAVRMDACGRADARVSLALLRLLGGDVEAGLAELDAAVERAARAGALAAVVIGAAHQEAIGTLLGRADLARRGRDNVDQALERVVDVRVRGLVAALRGEPGVASYLTRRAERVLAAVRGASAAHATGIIVAEDLSWIEVDGARTSLVRRGAMRRVLSALVLQQAARPGVALTAEEICAAGWPGERMRPDSARTRIYNVIRLLRGLGLASRIVTTDAGYLLDPAQPMRVERA